MHKLSYKVQKEFQKQRAINRVAKFLGLSSLTLKTKSEVRILASSIGEIDDHFTKIEALKGILSKIGDPVISKLKCVNVNVKKCYIKGKEKNVTVFPSEHTSTLYFPSGKKISEKDLLNKIYKYLIPQEDLPTKDAKYVYVNEKCVGSRFNDETVKALEEIYDGYKKWLDYKSNQ